MPHDNAPIKQDIKQADWNAGLSHVISESDFRLLAEYIGSVEYGSITIQIQDGKAIQIEKHEKVRIRRNSSDDDSK